MRVGRNVNKLIYYTKFGLRKKPMVRVYIQRQAS